MERRFCTSCGAALAAGAAFCPSCGAAAGRGPPLNLRPPLLPPSRPGPSSPLATAFYILLFFDGLLFGLYMGGLI